MKMIAVAAAALCCLVMAAPVGSGLTGPGAAGPAAHGDGTPATPRDPLACAAASDEVVVGLAGVLTPRLESRLEQVCGGGGIRRAFGPAGRKNTLVVRTGPGRTTRQAIGELKGIEGVAYAEPNYPSRALYTPPDPEFNKQWGLQNTGQTIQGTPGIPGADIRATNAWDIEDGTSSPVTVAVLDSGLNFFHADLDSRIWVNDDEIPANGIDDDGNGYPDDVNGYNFVGISQTRFYYLGGMIEYLFRDFGSASTNGLYAQSITGTGCELDHVGVLLERVGDPSSGVTVSVRTSLGGADLASFDIVPSEVGTGATLVYKELSSPLTLGSGSTYYLVFGTANNDPANYYHIYENQGSKNGNLYGEGQEWIWDGSTWTGSPPDDFYFRTNPNNYPRDDNGHGTYVTGIAAAEHSSAGIAGISKGSKVMPLKVLDASGVYSGALYTAEIAEAIYYAADNGARVISMSLGSYFATEVWQEAADYACSRGVVMAAAAGNDSGTIVLYPAGCENVLGVGATTNRDEKASFSNYNWTVDLSAPGKDVYSTSNSGGYSYGSGTSAATPHVAGVASLVLSRKPSYSAQDVELAMIDGSHDLGEPGREDYFGHGRLDALGALQAATTPPHLDSLTPDHGRQGDDVVIEGSFFRSVQAGSQVSFNGVPVTGYKSWSKGSVTCVVPAGASSGPVTLTTVNGTSDPLGFEVDVAPPPDPQSITPNSGMGTGPVDITDLAGTGFEAGATVKLARSGQPHIDATDVNVVSETKITCTFDLTGAVLGQWDVVVTNSDAQSGTLAGGFTVDWPAPTVAAITPSSAQNGATVQVTNLAGTNFLATPAVRLEKGGQPAIDATGVSRVSSTRLTCQFAIPPGASTGAWDVVVTNPDAKSAVKEGAFTITQPPPGSTWYLAEGTSDWGFDTYVTIQNPNPTDATVQVTYMTRTGALTRPDVPLPAGSQTVINPRNDMGATDFSTRVVCKEGKTICVDRRMTWQGAGAASPEGHSSVGVTSPAKTWYLPEGSSDWGFECWLLVQNPNAQAASLQVTYMIEGQGPVTLDKTVQANSRATFNMADDIGAADASIKVQSDVPVIPERAMYRNDRREGHDSIGTTTPATDYYLAEGTTDWGFTTYVLVQNPNNSDNTISITYMTPDGPVVQDPFTMEANSRMTVKVNDVVASRDLSVHVHGSIPMIAERAMYWDSGAGEACHDSIGMDSPHTTFYLPDGETYNGCETWTLVQNPNPEEVLVEVSYLTPTGEGNRTVGASLPADSRMTFNMADVLPSGRAAITVTCKTPGKKIMAERAMYWNNRGAGTDTIGGFSD